MDGSCHLYGQTKLNTDGYYYLFLNPKLKGSVICRRPIDGWHGDVVKSHIHG
jgi:hypothetical protein